MAIDGLIIPRAYNDYINKTDAATLSQALQLPNVMDSTPTENSNRPVRSGGIYTALAGKQPTLTFDTTPTEDSTNPVESGGIFDALATKQDILTLDGNPTKGSNNPVSSDGLYTALGAMFIHNAPRLAPKDITAYITDGTFWKRLAGTDGYALFEDIYVGDYFAMSRAISAYERTGQYQTTGSQYVTIAGLDTMMNNGDQGSGITYHHAVMVAGQGFGGTQHFGRSRMNATNTTEGGYKASEMNTLVLGDVVSAGSTAANATINQQLYAEFGAHLKTTRELVTKAINAAGYNRFGSATGCASDWEWISAQAILMSETECYGSIAWSSSGCDTGNANRQLPLFAFSKSAQNNHSAYYWLKDIASAACFCNASSDGRSDYYAAGTARICVRPRFILGA
jgi:hypothetical protein